jgi:hypothetical protein
MPAGLKGDQAYVIAPIDPAPAGAHLCDQNCRGPVSSSQCPLGCCSTSVPTMGAHRASPWMTCGDRAAREEEDWGLVRWGRGPRDGDVRGRSLHDIGAGPAGWCRKGRKEPVGMGEEPCGDDVMGVGSLRGMWAGLVPPPHTPRVAKLMAPFGRAREGSVLIPCPTTWPCLSFLICGRSSADLEGSFHTLLWHAP